MMEQHQDIQLQEASETLDLLYEISSLLKTGLDRESLSLCVSLIERGANPDALVAVIKELRRECSALKDHQHPS
ncbi:uncharacterized protein VTP21DRAFT_7811 [Calcarisporiella thermophila]|uniref:uncharacterized protein n=1 Tax=Calcarisporiella thermophila TaxID=911321 RepID=UPI003744532C